LVCVGNRKIERKTKKEIKDRGRGGETCVSTSSRGKGMRLMKSDKAR